MRGHVQALVLVLAGCAPGAPTEVHVHFDAEPIPRARAARLVIEVIDTEGRRETLPDIDLREGAGGRLPTSVILRPRGGEPRRTYDILGVLFDARGNAIASQRAIGSYVAGETREIWLLFEDACVDRLCEGARRETCRSGDCAGACIVPTPRGGPASPTRGTACSADRDAGPPPDDAGPGLPCADATLSECAGDELRTCQAGVLRTVPCPLGCSSADRACRRPLPSNVPSVRFEDGTASLSIPAGETWVVHTDTGLIEAFAGPASGPPARVVRDAVRGLEADIYFEPALSIEAPRLPSRPLGVFVVDRLRIEAGGALIGVGLAPLVVLAREVLVEGELSVAANRRPGMWEPGAGGFPGGQWDWERNVPMPGAGPGGGEAARSGVGDMTYVLSGGAGGSFGSRGGNGGDGDGDPIVPGGLAAADTYGTDDLVPLVGGSGGGGGIGGQGVEDGTLVETPAFGGNGGGAVQLTALERIVVSAGAVIDACGSGARTDGNDSGGGGGAGGGILLEAPIVDISEDAAIGANGGAGAAGNAPDGFAANGRPDQAPADGTTPAPPDGLETSGAGSDPFGSAQAGGRGQRAGGGGGGRGRIRIHTASGREEYPSLLPRLRYGASVAPVAIAPSG